MLHVEYTPGGKWNMLRGISRIEMYLFNSLRSAWASYLFQTWMNVTDTNIHTLVSCAHPPLYTALVWLQSVHWWRQGGGDLRETACWLARCMCVCVFLRVCELQLPAKKHQPSLLPLIFAPSSVSHLFVLLSAESATLPPCLNTLQTKSYPFPPGKMLYFSCAVPSLLLRKYQQKIKVKCSFLVNVLPPSMALVFTQSPPCVSSYCAHRF